jgi:photosystem II stability/assembly factor-like uncharacterized protein
VSTDAPTANSIRGIDCFGTNLCVGVGTNNTIIRTTDGLDWSTVTSPWGTATTTLHAVDIYSATFGFGLAVGDNGALLKTADAGITWTDASSSTVGTSNIYSVTVTSSTSAYIATSDSDFYRTQDSGVTWTNLSGTTFVDPLAIDSNGSNNVLVGGTAGYLYKSTDAASAIPAWATVNTGTTNSIYAIEVASSSIAYIGGTNRFIAKVTYSSSSSIVNLQILPDFGVTETVTDISCISTTNCIVTGNAGTVESTINGGSTWSSSAITGSYEPHAVAYYSASVAYLGAETGDILKYDVAGPNAPTNVAMSSGVLTNDSTPTITWTAATDTLSAISTYYFAVDSGVATNIGKVTTYTLTSALTSGSHTVSVYALDAAGNVGAVAGTSFTVDLTAPTLYSLTPTTATAGTAVTFSTRAGDSSGISSCSLYINDSNVGTLTYSGASESYTLAYTFAAAGSYSAYNTCVDLADNVATNTAITVTVSAAPVTADTTAPSVGSVSPTTATQSSATTFTASYSDTVGVTSCSLYVNSSNVGSMSLTGNVASLSYTPVSSGSYSMYVKCSDAAGNVGTGSTTTVTVAAASSSGSSQVDTTAPSVSGITPTTAIQNVATTFSTGYTDAVGVTSCSLYINGNSVGTMALTSGTASLSYTPTSEGSFTIYAKCWDAVGNVGTGNTATISVTIPASSYTSANPGSLVKMACEDGSEVNDPCRAVYYLDTTYGKRHAFPNEKVYFSWYADFDDVIIVTDSYMASLTLGKNVTYHPGLKLVKFITVNTVYAVGTGGELRGINSEATASAIYGTNWNHMVDDISDAFHGNYVFGTDITSAADYDAAAVYNSVDRIDEILQ